MNLRSCELVCAFITRLHADLAAVVLRLQSCSSLQAAIVHPQACTHAYKLPHMKSFSL